MLENVFPLGDLRALARARLRPFATKSAHPKLVDDDLKDGWTVLRKGMTSVRLKREKSAGVALEDRVWALLYKMQFEYLSASGNARLWLDPKDASSPNNQLDAVGIDSELAIAIECKSSERFSKRPQFQEELAKFSLFRERLSKAANAQWPTPQRRQIALLFFLQNINLSDADRERAKAANVLLFDETDVDYY